MKGRFEWALTIAIIALFLYVAPTLAKMAGDQLIVVGQAIQSQVIRVAPGVLASAGALGGLMWAVEHVFGWDHGWKTVKKVVPAALAVFGIPAAVLAATTLSPHLVAVITGIVNHVASSLGS